MMNKHWIWGGLLCLGFRPAAAQEFRVLLAAYVDKVPLTRFMEAGMKDISINTDQNNIYRYFLEFRTRDEAERAKREALKKGFGNAQVIDMEEQRALCGTPCPYISTSSMFVGETEDKLFLRSVYFDHDKTALRNDAKNTLDDLYLLLKNNPTFMAQLIGHTDSKEKDYQIEQSKRRVRTVRNHLISKGIPAYRIKTRVIAKEGSNPEGKQYNRVVMLAVIDGRGEVIHDNQKK